MFLVFLNVCVSFQKRFMGRKFQSNLEDRQQNSVIEEAFYIMRHNIYIYIYIYIYIRIIGSMVSPDGCV